MFNMQNLFEDVVRGILIVLQHNVFTSLVFANVDGLLILKSMKGYCRFANLFSWFDIN